MRRLVILGATEFSLEIADLVGDTGDFEICALVENDVPQRGGRTMGDIPVLWIDEAAPLAKTHLALCALGTTRRSRFTEQATALGFRFATIVHPTAHVSRTTSLAEGVFVGAGAVIGSHTTIGRHTIVNRGGLVGHHTVIGNHVSLQAGANGAGLCKIGDGTYLGMGSLVLNKLSVGADSVVGAGAVVTKDVPDRVQVVGIPARIVAREIDGK